MTRRSGLGSLAAVVAGVFLHACGGDGTGPTPPPPPPPPPPPGAVARILDMSVGESVTLTDPDEVRAFQIDGGSGPREYEVIVQSASETSGATTAMQLRVRAAGASAAGAPSPSRSTVRRGAMTDRELALRASSFKLETGLRESMRREMARVRGTPIRQRLDASASVASARSQPPVLGEMLTVGFGVVGSGGGIFADCDSGAEVTGEVKFVGQHFTVVEDVQLAGQFSNADYQEIGLQLDATVYPTVTSYFGDPADLDGNLTVIALITAEVNKLTASGSNSIIAGFFFSGDLIPRSQCAASNEGEIFYLIGPDPSGTHGPTISLDFANTLARTTVAHEFLHLINSERRTVMSNGPREEAWLDEALAHLAEEVSGFAAAGLGTRDNLDLATAVASDLQLEAFNDFHLLNLDRFAGFMHAGPEQTRALGDTGGGDPGGVESLDFRGFGYGFARWLGSQFGPTGNGVLPGSQEELLFQFLSEGGPSNLTGIANVEAAVQSVAGASLQWDELLSLYLGSLVMDDNAPAGLEPRMQNRTWDLRALFEQLNGSNLGDNVPFNRPYPLVPTVVSFGSTMDQTLSFTLNSSTGKYVTIRSPATMPDAIFEVTTSSGAALPMSVGAQVTIIRTG